MDLHQVRLSDNPSLQERAYGEIRAAILNMTYAPGQRLNESALAEAFGISRNPIREALRRLQQDGLVEVRTRTGAFVQSLTPGEAEDIYRIRAALEGTAAALAAERATDADMARMEQALRDMEAAAHAGMHAQVVREADRFHFGIYVAAASDRLCALLEQIYAQVTWFRNVTLRSPGRPPQAHQEHFELLGVIRSGDAEGADELARRHVLGAYAMLKEQIGRQSPEGDDMPPERGRRRR